jgi:AcrR family transcriptional regulator
VGERQDPVERILLGLVAAIDRHGSEKVSVADVCEAAGVSRGTVYRYFPTREDLFAALGAHTIAMFRRVLDEAVRDHPAVERRFTIVVTAINRVTGDGRHFRESYRTQPAYMLHHFQSMWAEILGVLRDALAPAFPEAERDGHRVDVAADVLARHMLTQQLIPSPHTGEADLVAVLEAYAAAPAHREAPV